MANDSKALYVYIENRIVESIQMYCQWQLYLQLLYRTSENEMKNLKEILQPKMLEEIQKYAHCIISICMYLYLIV